MSRDARLTPARPDLASRDLEGVVAAARYVDPQAMQAKTPATAIRGAPAADAEQLNQLLFGERFVVLEVRDGFAWGQALRDGYVGFVAADDLGPAGPEPTHWVSALRTYAFAQPSIKTAAQGPFSLNALAAVEAREGRFAKVAGAGWIVEQHLTPIGRWEDDWAGVAERFLEAPYLWGGRESLGLDCSGLAQQALMACGRACPRDSDQQAAGVGRPVTLEEVTRGDLVFWRGHVAIALDARRIIHANAHHMAVAVEPLEEAVRRIAAAGAGEPTAVRRPFRP